MNLGDEHDYNMPNALFLADVLERSAQTHTQANAAAEMRRLVAQRDALLEACKTLVHLRETEDWMETLHKAVNQARAAIKAAEEENT